MVTIVLKIRVYDGKLSTQIKYSIKGRNITNSGLYAYLSSTKYGH